MYRTIETSLWDDPKVLSLDSPAKLLFIYLITNRWAHVSGIYRIPAVIARSELAFTDTVYDRVCDRVSGAGLASFDQTREIVFVKNMMRYQGRGEKNERSAANQLKTLHNSFLIKEFLDFYPSVKRYVSDTLLDRVSDTVSRVGIQEQEQEQEQESTAPLASLPENPANLENMTKQENLERTKEKNPPREKDEAYEIWAERFQELRKVRYGSKAADFVWLAKLRKQLQLDGRGTPPGWQIAIDNYLATPQGKYTLADLCSRYDVFLADRLDRFGKPEGSMELNPEQRSRRLSQGLCPQCGNDPRSCQHTG